MKPWHHPDFKAERNTLLKRLDNLYADLESVVQFVEGQYMVTLHHKASEVGKRKTKVIGGGVEVWDKPNDDELCLMGEVIAEAIKGLHYQCNRSYISADGSGRTYYIRPDWGYWKEKAKEAK